MSSEILKNLKPGCRFHPAVGFFTFYLYYRQTRCPPTLKYLMLCCLNLLIFLNDLLTAAHHFADCFVNIVFTQQVFFRFLRQELSQLNLIFGNGYK